MFSNNEIISKLLLMLIKHLLVSGFDHWRHCKQSHLNKWIYLPLIFVLSFFYFCQPNFQSINLPDMGEHDVAERRRWFIKRMAYFFLQSASVTSSMCHGSVAYDVKAPIYLALSQLQSWTTFFFGDIWEHYCVSVITVHRSLRCKMSDSYRWHVI